MADRWSDRAALSTEGDAMLTGSEVVCRTKAPKRRKTQAKTHRKRIGGSILDLEACKCLKPVLRIALVSSMFTIDKRTLGQPVRCTVAADGSHGLVSVAWRLCVVSCMLVTVLVLNRFQASPNLQMVTLRFALGFYQVSRRVTGLGFEV